MIQTRPCENPKSEELSENKDDGESGSGFKLNAAKKTTTTNSIYITCAQTTTST